MNINYISVLMSAALSVAISACGGGGSDTVDTTPVTPEPSTSTPTTTIDDEFTLWLTDLSNNVILPHYKTFSERTEQLLLDSQSYCQLTNPNQDDLTLLKTSWVDVNAGWQQVQWVKIGPVLESNRNLRVHLWPADYVMRDVESYLSTQTVLTAEDVSKSSVSGQGLLALEYLLYPSDEQYSLINATDSEKRCEVLMAISENLSNISQDIYQEWLPTSGNYVDQVISGTGEFTSAKDAVEELVTNWLEQVERVKDDKMLDPLADVSPGLPEISEFVLSDQAINSIQMNVRVFELIFTAGDGHGFDDILTEFLEQDAIATQMAEKITDAITAVNALSGNYALLLSSPEGRADISHAIQEIRELRDILSVDFIQATDINIGFNSNDGD